MNKTHYSIFYFNDYNVIKMLNEDITKLNITDYSVRFNYNGVNYEIEFDDLINFIRDYYCPDDIIGDFDDLCYLVESFANSYDMIQVLRLCNNLTEDMLGSEYFVIDSVYLEVYGVDNVKELLDIYDIEDILNEMVENDKIEEYCDKYSNEYRPDTYHMDFSKYHTNKARVVKKIKLNL